MVRAKLFDDVEFRDFGGISYRNPFGIHRTLQLRNDRTFRKPIHVVQGQTRHRKEQHNNETEHRQIDVQPPRPRR